MAVAGSTLALADIQPVVRRRMRLVEERLGNRQLADIQTVLELSADGIRDRKPGDGSDLGSATGLPQGHGTSQIPTC